MIGRWYRNKIDAENSYARGCGSKQRAKCEAKKKCLLCWAGSESHREQEFLNCIKSVKGSGK